MPMPPPARPGDPLSAVDTPALVVDLDAFERNLAKMAEATRRMGVKLRGHAKTHKSPIIARRQMALGAVGVCCQKVSEAQAMVEGGVDDVLVSNEVAGAAKLARLAGLARQANVMVCTDDAANVAEIAAAAEQAGVRIGTLVEIDVGASRCGVPAGEAAADLARLIAGNKHLRFAGLQAYQGRAQHLRTPEERKAAIEEAVRRVKLTLSALDGAGLKAEIVGGAGTGTYTLEGASGVYTELQAGSYVFMDADYARNKGADGEPYRDFEHALYVHATVMSMTAAERAVVDAGLKALAFDSGMPEVSSHAGARYERPSDEHGNLDVSACNVRPKRGDRVLLIPGHCDPTVNLHDWYVAVRGLASPSTARVEAVWPVAARGALF
jgi:3-hydroxy-D-aspartate aldolase